MVVVEGPPQGQVQDFVPLADVAHSRLRFARKFPCCSLAPRHMAVAEEVRWELARVLTQKMTTRHMAELEELRWELARVSTRRRMTYEPHQRQIHQAGRLVALEVVLEALEATLQVVPCVTRDRLTGKIGNSAVVVWRKQALARRACLCFFANGQEDCPYPTPTDCLSTSR